MHAVHLPIVFHLATVVFNLDSVLFHLVSELFHLVTFYFTFPVRFQLSSNFSHIFLNGQFTHCTINCTSSVSICLPDTLF